MHRYLRLLPQIVTVAAICVIITAGDLHSFDQRREGFVFGFGVGLGALSTYDRDVETPLGFQTDLTIGAGISDRVELHYTGKQFWYWEDDEFFSLGNPLIGLTYYIRPQAPSVFLSASVGLAIGIAFWRDSGGILAGPGYHVGAGYEFARHWNMKFDIVISHLPAADWDPVNFILSVNLLGY